MIVTVREGNIETRMAQLIGGRGRRVENASIGRNIKRRKVEGNQNTRMAKMRDMRRSMKMR